MKSLIVYGSYGYRAMLAEVEKELDRSKLEDYREPNKVYKITSEYLDCYYVDLDVRGVLKDVNYSSDNIGFVGNLTESYIVPVTDEQFSNLLKSVDEKKNNIINSYNQQIGAFKKADFLTRSEILSQMLCDIISLEQDVRDKIYENLLCAIAEIHEDTLKKARETGVRQVLSMKKVKCCFSDEECNHDIITEYLTPSDKKEEERTHTY